MELEQSYIISKLSGPIFEILTESAESLQLESYLIGGFVRDLILRRSSKDIDVVCVGSGIELAQEVANRLGDKAKFAFFKNYGTAQVKYGDVEIEFVGARKESYTRDSRNPVVENGTLQDDLNRRDFTDRKSVV
jgi:poly(A) polymerase